MPAPPRPRCRLVGSVRPASGSRSPWPCSPPSSWPSSSAGRGCTSGAEAQDRADALAAARQIAVNFSTLDYRHFDQDIARVTSGATGSFRSDFAGQAAQIKQVVVADKSTSTGQVGQVAFVSSSPTSARALVVLDATVTNTSATTPTARHYRVQLDLTKVHGRWLASQLTFVG